MNMPLLAEAPLAPPRTLGPFRRHDYDQLPDEPRCELILGRFYVSPSPSPLHQILVSFLWRQLDQIGAAAGGLALLAPLDVALDEHSVVQPDVLYVSPERRTIVKVRERVEGVPDLLVEVLSPGTARRDRVEKLRLYAESGVREYWIVDPLERQIEFLVNQGGRFTVAVPAGPIYRSEVLLEVFLDLEEFWQGVARRLGS